MNARQEADPRVDELRRRLAQARAMLELPLLFTAEEILGQLLDAARLGFEFAGVGHDETQRRALFEALAGYVDVPDSAGGYQEAMSEPKQAAYIANELRREGAAVAR